MKKLRILHAPAIVINQQWIISRAQRELGCTSDFMVFNADKPELPVRDCDINFHFDRNDISPRPGNLLKTLLFLIKFSFFFITSLFKYDVFHFHSESFFGSRSTLDLKILRLFRKKIVFQYWGCDIRLKSLSVLSSDFSTCDACIRVCQNTRKLRDNLNHLKYADFRVYGGADAMAVVPDAIFVPIAIDLNYWKPGLQIPKEHLLPATKNVRILQAFENPGSRGDLKGTRFIKAAVDALKKEGCGIDYIFLDKIPHDSMRYYYQQADIVVDQLLTGWHGSVTVEAMAMGRPVICYLDEKAVRFLPKDHPIVNANPATVADKLRELVKDPGLRSEIGSKSRLYVEDRHDALKLAGIYIDLYKKKWI